MTGEEYSLLGLFLSAFLSSTILPGTSEVVFVVLAAEGDLSIWSLLTIATTGNTLGGMSSWALGWLIGWRYPLSVGGIPLRSYPSPLNDWQSNAFAIGVVRFFSCPGFLLSGIRFAWRQGGYA